MKYLFLFFLMSVTVCVKSQNLVPNHSFETVECQTAFFFPFGCPVTHNAPWIMPSQGSSDSFNTCHTGDFGSFGVPSNFQGYQEPVSLDDNGYVGIITFEGVGEPNYREYIQVELSEELQAGITYDIGFWCTHGSESQVITDGVDMFISNGPVSTNTQTVIQETPQLESGIIFHGDSWTEVAGTYTALGGENYITIGNFNEDQNTEGLHLITGSFDRAFYYIDNVRVINPLANDIGELTGDLIQLSVSPNPAEDFVDVFIIEQQDHVFLLDVFGKVIAKVKLEREADGWKTRIDISNLSNGIYFIRTDNVTTKLIKT